MRVFTISYENLFSNLPSIMLAINVFNFKACLCQNWVFETQGEQKVSTEKQW